MKAKRKSGQSVVEFALLVPFFLLIVVGGIIDFGFIFHNYLTLQHITHETAQWAAEQKKGQGLGNAAAKVASYRPTWWTGSLTLKEIQEQPLTTGGKCIRVVVTYESPLYTPLYQSVSDSFLLSAVASYKIPQTVTTRD